MNDHPMTIGIDLGDRSSHFYSIGSDGVVEKGKVATSETAFRKHFESLRPCRIAIECGTHSPWVSRVLSELGHEVIVANARKLRAIYESDKKDDAIDARMLAKIARLDPELLSPIRHRGKEAQAMLATIKARAACVAMRSKLINQIRSLCKSAGARIACCSSEAFAKKAVEQIPSELHAALQPLVDVVCELTKTVAAYDKRIARVAGADQAVKNLTTVHSVGHLTALSFVLTLEDPRRFRKSRLAGAYLGLRPRLDRSGNTDKQLGISKSGDAYLRTLLVQCAQHLLGPFGKDCELRQWGLALSERGGASAKKRAVVAVARKLAVTMHRLWLTGDPFEPFHQQAVLASLKSAV